MSIWSYLKDRAMDIAVYLIAVGMVNAVTYLDANIRMMRGNAVYLTVILLTLGLFYLTVDYMAKRRHVQKIKQIGLQQARIEMPAAKDSKEQRYQDLVREIIKETDELAVRKDRDNLAEIEFLTLLAHRLKTPVTAMRLITEKADERTKHALEQELFRLQEDVDKMLYYARGREFSDDYVIEPACLDKIVATSVKKHARLFIGKGIKVQTENLDKAVLTDKKWLGFIVDQLVSNAVKYSGSQGTVHIFAEESDVEVVLVVCDDGIGIGQEDLPRVLNRSFTGSNGRLGAGSTGMGLYLANKLAKKLEHQMYITSTKGHGTRAAIHISKFSDNVM